MGGTKRRHLIRQGGVRSGDPQQYDYDQIANYIRSADSKALSALAGTYGRVQYSLKEAQQLLENHAGLLGSVWKSGAAGEAVNKVRQMQVAAGTLATASYQFLDAMRLAARTVESYKTTLPNRSLPRPPGVITSNTGSPTPAERADDRRAQEHMRQMNAGLASAYEAIPAAVTLELPVLNRWTRGGDPAGGARQKTGSGSPEGTGSAASGTVRTGSSEDLHEQTATSAHLASTERLSSTSVVGPGGIGSSAGPSELAGVPPPGAVGPVAPGAGGQGPGGLGAAGPAPGGTGAGGLGRPGIGPLGAPFGGLGPGIPPGAIGPGGRVDRGSGLGGPRVVGGTGAIGSRPPGFGPIGPGGVIQGGTATPRAAGTLGNRNLAGLQSGVIGRSGAGGPFMPMSGAGAAGTSQERERNTWLSEEEDLWDDDDAPSPPVIGG